MALTSPKGYPLEHIDGNTGSMSYWAGLFGRVGSDLDSLRTSAQSASGIAGVGAAITAARTDADELVAALGPDIAEAELLQGVIQRYADAWESSAKHANDLVDDIESAHTAWSTAADEAQRAGLTALWASRSGPEDEAATANADARDAIEARDSAKTALDELWTQFEGLYEQWDAAYDTALAELAGGSGSQLTSSARDLLDEMLAANSAADVLALWNAHPELHAELSEREPGIIGNLDGIPYEVRAAVNLEQLTQLRNSQPGGALGDQIEGLWKALATGPPPPLLISFDPSGSEQVTAALAYGDLVNATDINVLVPGMNSQVGGIGEWGTTARDLNSAGPGLASIVWFGYDSPNETEEPAMDRARDGAAALRSFLLGLGAVQPSADVAVIAHSYGSTTAALAIGSSADALGVDKFIAVGSAGFPSDADVLANLQNAPGLQMYATLSDNDLWARVGRDTSWLGEHGTVPETLPGVIEFGSDGGYAENGDSLAATPGHGAHGGANGVPWQSDARDGYLMSGSESFYNIQQIILTGEPGTQMDGAGSQGGAWDLPDWIPTTEDRRYHL